MESIDELEFGDRWALARLKYLRQRSLSNGRYRDDAMVRKFVSVRRGGQLNWNHKAPLKPFLDDVNRELDVVRNIRHVADREVLDRSWQKVVAAVDALLAEGEKRAGQRIRGLS